MTISRDDIRYALARGYAVAEASGAKGFIDGDLIEAMAEEVMQVIERELVKQKPAEHGH